MIIKPNLQTSLAKIGLADIVHQEQYLPTESLFLGFLKDLKTALQKQFFLLKSCLITGFLLFTGSSLDCLLLKPRLIPQTLSSGVSNVPPHIMIAQNQQTLKKPQTNIINICVVFENFVKIVILVTFIFNFCGIVIGPFTLKLFFNQNV